MPFVSHIRLSLFFGGALLLCGFVVAPSRAGDCAECDRKLSLLERRPCGPDAITGPLRFLFYQGCYGADFRSACRRHDACYDTIGSCRACCDREFLKALLAECDHSKFPAHSRFRARLSYWVVSVAGQPAWESAQRLAIRTAQEIDPEPPSAPPREAFTGIFAGFAKMPLFATGSGARQK